MKIIYTRMIAVVLFPAAGFIAFAQNTSASKTEKERNSLQFFKADNPYIQYTGRIDFSNPALPRFWSPGVYIKSEIQW